MHLRWICKGVSSTKVKKKRREKETILKKVWNEVREKKRKDIDPLHTRQSEVELLFFATKVNLKAFLCYIWISQVAMLQTRPGVTSISFNPYEVRTSYVKLMMLNKRFFGGNPSPWEFVWHFFLL